MIFEELADKHQELLDVLSNSKVKIDFVGKDQPHPMSVLQELLRTKSTVMLLLSEICVLKAVIAELFDLMTSGEEEIEFDDIIGGIHEKIDVTIHKLQEELKESKIIWPHNGAGRF